METPRPVIDPTLSPLDGGQTLFEAVADGIIGLFGGEPLADSVMSPGCWPWPGSLTGIRDFPEEFLDPGALGFQQRPCPLVVHRSSSWPGWTWCP